MKITGHLHDKHCYCQVGIGKRVCSNSGLLGPSWMMHRTCMFTHNGVYSIAVIIFGLISDKTLFSAPVCSHGVISEPQILITVL